MSCVSKNKFKYIDVKTIYRGKPKDRNIETELMIYKRTEKLDSVRKDKVQTRLR